MDGAEIDRRFLFDYCHFVHSSSHGIRWSLHVRIQPWLFPRLRYSCCRTNYDSASLLLGVFPCGTNETNRHNIEDCVTQSNKDGVVSMSTSFYDAFFFSVYGARC
jgi:hypothetical protein